MERFHGTFRPDFLNDAGPFETVDAAQAAVDRWVEQYNTDRPHQGLDPKTPVMPADRFAAVPDEQRQLLPTWLPAALEAAVHSPGDTDAPPSTPPPAVGTVTRPGEGGPVELERTVPASGNLEILGQQYWLGPARAGQVVHFWIDWDMVHLTIGGVRVKTIRSHYTVKDLARLAADGARPAGPPPLPCGDDTAIEVERAVSRGGTVALGGHVVLAAEILGGRQVGIRIENNTLMFFDLETRELLRARPNPLAPARPSSCAESGPPGRRYDRPWNRSPFNAAPPTPGSSWCAVRRSRSAASTGTRRSPSTCPRPPSPSSSTTTRYVPSGAPPPCLSVTSKPTGHGRSPQFSRSRVAHQVADKRRTSPVGSHASKGSDGPKPAQTPPHAESRTFDDTPRGHPAACPPTRDGRFCLGPLPDQRR